MLKILFQPYPFTEKTWQRIIFQGCYEGGFVALFLIIIQPFGITEMQGPNKNLILASYGIVTGVCGTIMRLGIFRLFPHFFSESSWTIIKEIGTILFLILLISIVNYIPTILFFKTSFDGQGFIQMLSMVLTIGIFPTVFGVMLNYIIQLKKYNHPFEVEKPVVAINNVPVLSSFIKLTAENEKDGIELSPDDLFYIESSDNYSTIFYSKENRIQQLLLRSSLNRLENQLQSNRIVRCHRSFIVNLEKVSKVSGNAQGYKLHLDSFLLQVPVARKYSEIINELKAQ